MMISTTEELLSGPLPDVTVGIGRGTSRGNVEASVYDSENILIYDDPRELVSDLMSGRIGAAVRGDMPSDKVVPLLREAFGVEKLERAALMEPAGGGMFLLAPVGIDEGWDVDEMFRTASRAADLARRVGMCDRIAVMSGGRTDDRGRHPRVDETMDNALEVVSRLSASGYDAYHCQITVEDAVGKAGVILAPDGIVGNVMFRVMHLVDGGRSLGAPVLNSGKVFIDTSRAKTDYRDSIALAKRLTEGSS